MKVLKNKDNERKTIQYGKDKSIVLLAKGTHAIDEKDIESPIIQQLIKNGEVVVLGDVEKRGKKEFVSTKEKDKQ